MEINVNAKGVLEINNARIVFRNFAGAPSKFNREGDRNFGLIIDDAAIAEQLRQDGWNVKAKGDPEDPYYFMTVKVKFNSYGPYAQMVSNGVATVLGEETIATLDNIDIEKVDLDVRPYDWEMNGRTGRTAYLSAISVTCRSNRFANFQAPAAEEDLPF